MITSMQGTTRIEGAKHEVMSEITCILRSFYETVKEREGEQQAMEQLAEMGRLAVMTSEELEDAVRNLVDEILN